MSKVNSELELNSHLEYQKPSRSDNQKNPYTHSRRNIEIFLLHSNVFNKSWRKNVKLVWRRYWIRVWLFDPDTTIIVKPGSWTEQQQKKNRIQFGPYNRRFMKNGPWSDFFYNRIRFLATCQTGSAAQLKRLRQTGKKIIRLKPTTRSVRRDYVNTNINVHIYFFCQLYMYKSARPNTTMDHGTYNLYQMVYQKKMCTCRVMSGIWPL